MAPSQPNVIQVVETEAKLWADEGISWGVELSSNAVGLKAKDTRSNIVNIISPTRNNRVSINSC